MAFCFSDGNMDFLLDSASVEHEASPPSSSQTVAEEKTPKATNSPKDRPTAKDSQASSLKDTPSPKETASSPKTPCLGKKKAFWD